MASLRKRDYDTEEREFIADLFFELSTITNVDFKNNLNSWLYDPFLVFLMRVQRILRPERIIETLHQPCTDCATPLETHILRKEPGIPDYNWLIVKCNHCNSFNLLSTGPDIKEVRFVNYQQVEALPKKSFTYEQAQIRLEQIRFFRKQ